MTSDEFRKILDRFHGAIGWLDDEAMRPDAYRELDRVWRDLNRECSRMKDAQGRLDTAIEPTRSLPMSLPAVNAEAIGTLQAKVAQLEGTVRSLTRTIAEAFEMVEDGETYRAMSHMDKVVEQQDRTVLADGSVPE